MSDSQEVVFDRLLKRFEDDVLQNIKNDKASGKLDEEGRCRLHFRKDILTLMQNNLDVPQQMQFVMKIANMLHEVPALILAKECYANVLEHCHQVPGTEGTLLRIQATHGVASCDHQLLLATSNFYLAPKALSRALTTASSLTAALELLMEFNASMREEYAWLVLNTIKLIYRILKPMLWLNCGKYVTETLIYCSLCMDAVINLCTARHLKLKCKLISTALSALFTYASMDEIAAVIHYLAGTVAQLRAREELDPPIPATINDQLLAAEYDIAVFKAVLAFWRNPEGFALNSVPAPSSSMNFAESVILEISRNQQLTCGNPNEAWKKRSTALLNLFSGLMQSDEKPVRQECLLDVTIVAMFDVVEVDVPPLLQQIFDRAERDDDSATIYLSLLQSLVAYTSTKKVSDAIIVVQHISNIIQSNAMEAKRGLLRRVCLCIWSKILYPTLQHVLTSTDTAATTAIDDILPSFTTIVSTLDLVGLEDPLLVANLALIVSQFLLLKSDYRQAITVLTKALQNIDMHRSSRVDVQLHCPEEGRDILALQHASVTTTPTPTEWFHSLKRLGANAFAGFGLFGSSSSISQYDQAVANTHTDLVVLLLRTELKYNISTIATKLANKSKNAKSAAPPATTTVAAATTINITPVDDLVENVEKLPCVVSLRASIAKSSYTRALLYIVMADFESSADLRQKYYVTSMELLAETEKHEAMLTTQDLLTITASPKPPLILARSADFFYICPTTIPASNIHHFQIFGRELGSGTEVSHTSDELAGCDTLVLRPLLQSPASAAVKISSVRYGEKYSFASGAYSNSNKLISVSPSTIGVEAVNPLPILQLYSYLCLSAAKMKHMKVSRQAATLVVNHFLKQSPSATTVTLGRYTVFAAPEFYLNEIALHLATPLMLQLFVQCFLVLEGGTSVTDEVVLDIDSVALHWQRRKQQQIDVITLANKLARVVTVAMRLHHQEYIVRLSCLLYNTIATVIQYDVLQIAQFLQNPLLVFLTAMQSVNRNNWRSIDHTLYCRFLLYAVQCGIVSGNIAAMVPVLRKYWTDELNSSLDIEKITFATLDMYMSTVQGLNAYNKVLQTTELNQQHEAVLATAAVDVFWETSPAERQYHLRKSIDMMLNATETASDIVKLREEMENVPVTTSTYMSALLCCVDELSKNGNSQQIPHLFSKYPLQMSTLCENVASKCKEWNLTQSILRFDNTENETERDNNIVEEQLQLRTLAWLVYLFMTSQYAENKRNDFPEHAIGCYAIIAYDDLARLQNEPDVEENALESTVEAVAEPTAVPDTTTTTASEAPVVETIDSISYVRHLLFSAVILIECQCPLSAIDVLNSLWNYIVNTWQHPIQFASSFAALKKELTTAVLSIVQLFESQTTFEPEEEVMSINSTVMSRYPRDIKQMLYSCKDVFVYLIKVLAVMKQWDQVVDSGLRVLDVYIYHAPTYCKFIADQIISVMNFAQDELTQAADNKVVKKQRDLDNYIAAYEEIQAKKRKKKLRVARAEKSEDEVKFEADKHKLQSRLEQLQNIHASCVERRDSITKKEKRVESLCSTGAQLLAKVRANRNSFLDQLNAEIARRHVSYIDLLRIKEYNEKYEEIIEHFEVVAQFVREKKERGLLVECLNELGDFYLVFGVVDKAQMSWRDAIDGLFNVLDAWRSWRDVLSDEKVQQDDVILQYAILTLIVLGKLSRHCSDNNFDLKSNYCSMAAELCQYPFYEGVGHPQNLAGFAAYQCLDLGGRNSIDFRFDILSPTVLEAALDEITLVLGRANCHLECMPVFALHEHFHSYYTHRCDAWLGVRLRRIEYLAILHYFAEASSLLSGIPTNLKRIAHHIHSSPLQHLPGYKYTANELDVSENGLHYYGYPGYFNHLPPEHETNKSAIAWISSCYSVIKPYFEELVVFLPIPVKTAEELEAERIKAAEIAAAKEAEKAKNKKKTKEAEEVVAEPPPVPTKPLIEEHQHVQLQIVISIFLNELSSLDERSSAPQVETLQQLRTSCTTLTSTVLEVLLQSPQWSDCMWLNQYLSLNLIIVRQLLQIRNYTGARACILGLLKQLSNQPAMDNMLFKNTLMQYWFEFRHGLVVIGMYQGRFSDSIVMANQLSAEVSRVHHSYWYRRFQLVLSLLLFKSGALRDCKEVLSALIENYQTNYVVDVEYIRCLALYASAIKSLASNVTAHAANALLLQALACLKTGYQAATQLCAKFGHLGADINATYNSCTKNSMLHHQLPPVLHNLTNIYENYPDVLSSNTSCGSNGNKTRLGPVDISTTYASSSFINIYLSAVRCLATISCSYCQLLDELRIANASSSDNSVTEELRPNDLLKEEIYVGEAALKVLLLCAATIIFDVILFSMLLFCLRTHYTAVAKILQVLRYIVYPNSFVKSDLLALVGKARIASTAPNLGTHTHVITIANTCIGTNAHDVLLSPLVASLTLATQGNHHYDIMKTCCIELIECYGNSSITLPLDSAIRLKLAVKYLLLATRLENMKRDIDCNVLGMMEKGLASELCTPELLSLLSDVTSTSLLSSTPPVTSAAVSDKKAKIKKQDSNASVENSPTARDAIFVLSTYYREADALWFDSTEYSFLQDLFCHLKALKCFAEAYAISTLPTEKEELVVENSSVTSLWKLAPSHDAGLFSATTGYFLLGGIKKDQNIPTSETVNMTTEEPLLYKLNTSRAQLMQLEEQFRLLAKTIHETQNKENEQIHAAKRFAALLSKLFLFLRGGERDGEVVASKAKQKGANLSATLTVNDAQICEIEATEKNILHIAAMLSLDRGAFQVKCDVNVSMIFWVAFRLQ